MKISVITPAVREAELELNRQSLLKQTFKDFEWIVCSPFPYTPAGFRGEKLFGVPDPKYVWVKDVPLNDGDFMGENKAYNELFKAISPDSELVVTLNDSIYMRPNALEVFWKHYLEDPMSCVALLGNHYKIVTPDGTGVDMTYEDIRRNQVHSAFETTNLTNFDACCSSIPAKVVRQVKQIDPIWDKYCCFGIREFMCQVMAKGYKLYASTESEYLGQKHEKLYDRENLWNEKFKAGDLLFHQRGNKL